MFPSSALIREENERAAAETFRGYAPQLALALVACAALGCAAALLLLRLAEADRLLALGVV
jgi:hypothetical protein